MHDTVIPASLGNRLFWIAVTATVVVSGMALVLWFNPFAAESEFEVFQQKLFFTGCFLVVGGCIALLVNVVRLLWRCDLRIAHNSMQLVNRRGDVVGNMPYSNIARVELGGQEAIPWILIWLRDPRSADTYWGTRLARWWTRREAGCDVTLGAAWKMPVAELFDHLEARLKEYQQASGTSAQVESGTGLG